MFVLFQPVLVECNGITLVKPEPSGVTVIVQLTIFMTIWTLFKNTKLLALFLSSVGLVWPVSVIPRSCIQSFGQWRVTGLKVPGQVSGSGSFLFLFPSNGGRRGDDRAGIRMICVPRIIVVYK